MSVRTPLLLPKDTELLFSPNRKLRKRKLATPGMDGFRKKSSVERISEELLLISQMQGEQVQTLTSNRPGVSGVVGVLRD